MRTLFFNKSVLAFMCFALSFTHLNAQKVLSVKKFRADQIEHLTQEETQANSIEAFKIVYSTIDVKGDPTFASGLLLIPTNKNLEMLPIAIFGHGSTSKRRYVPSELNFQADYAAKLAIAGYITLAPDYIGLGDSPGFHPYLHSQTEATASLDMLRAVRSFFVDEYNTTIRKDIYITGYSQGGHAAMATHRYIEENKLSEEFLINANAPCSGPYSLSNVMFEYVIYLNKLNYCDPELILHSILSAQYVHESLYANTSEYFKAPYDSILNVYMKNDCDFNLNDHFPKLISAFIQEEVIDDWENNTENSFRATMKNFDVDNWKPIAPVKMFYTEADVIVPYKNTLLALENMQKIGANNVSATKISSELDHNQAMDPIMEQLIIWFNEIESKKE